MGSNADQNNPNKPLDPIGTCRENSHMTNMTTSAPIKVRPKPQVMRLTDAAAARVRELMARTDQQIIGLRVGVKNGGCAGMSYTVEYAEDVKKNDEMVEDKGVKILIDPKAVLFLLGTEMDF